MRQRKDATEPGESPGAGREASPKPAGRAARGRSAGYSKGQAKREEILTGLMGALNQGVLRNPSLKAIGQTLGVEPAHILYYFGSREALLQAVIERWDEDSVERRDGAAPDARTMDLDEYVAAVAKNVTKPGIVHLYLAFAAEAVEPSHPAHEFIRLRFESVQASLAKAIGDEQQAGTIPAGIDAEVEARLLIALADGLQLQSLIDPKIDALAHLKSAIAQIRADK